MFIFQSKGLFSQGSVYNFEIFCYLMGKKSGKLVCHYPPWLGRNSIRSEGSMI